MNATTLIANFETKFNVKNPVPGAEYYITFPESVKNSSKTIVLDIKASKSFDKDGEIVENMFKVGLEFQEETPPIINEKFLLSDEGVLSFDPKWIESEGFEKWTGDLEIPAKINDKEVKSIVKNFSSNISEKITSLTFEQKSNLTRIEEMAFENCTNLIGEVKFPVSLKYIENAAFPNTGIKTIFLNDGLLEVGELTFAHNKNLTGKMTLPTSLETLGWSLFYGCTDSELLIQTSTNEQYGDRGNWGFGLDETKILQPV
ncbi:MAG: leucine-rich repeat domain-containing protein [Mycoplasma sp.]